MTKDEALKLAQKALSNRNAPPKTIYEALHAIKEALSKPEQEFVAKIYDPYDCNGLQWFCSDPPNTGTKLYTTPPQRTLVGLTDEEILAVNMSTVTKLIDEPIVCDTDHNIVQLALAIEAKLKAKNGFPQEEKNT